MATLKYDDILKRNNVQVLLNRIHTQGEFLYKTHDGPSLVCTGKTSLKSGTLISNTVIQKEALNEFLNNRVPSDYLEIEVNNGYITSYHRLTNFFKDKEFGGTAAKNSENGSERQEIGLLKILNEYSGKRLKPNSFYSPIKEARKNTGLSLAGQEPYIDIFIETHCGFTYGVSMKGTQSPSLAGGGITGIKRTVPELLDKLYDALINYLHSMGLKSGDVISADDIPDLYLKIPNEYLKIILTGTVEMGGPVDFMYVGDLNVNAQILDDTLLLNGTLY